MSTYDREFTAKMRRLRAEQEREFLEEYNRSLTEQVIDWFDGIFGRCGEIHQWKVRWRMRFVRRIGEYTRRNKPERVIYVAKYGETRKTWSQYQHFYNVHTFFGVYEFVEFEHKTTGEIKWDERFPLYTKTKK